MRMQCDVPKFLPLRHKNSNQDLLQATQPLSSSALPSQVCTSALINSLAFLDLFRSWIFFHVRIRTWFLFPVESTVGRLWEPPASVGKNTVCILSVHRHSPFIHQTSITKLKFKDKMMKRFKTVTAEHSTKFGALLSTEPSGHSMLTLVLSIVTPSLCL